MEILDEFDHCIALLFGNFVCVREGGFAWSKLQMSDGIISWARSSLRSAVSYEHVTDLGLFVVWGLGYLDQLCVALAYPYLPAVFGLLHPYVCLRFVQSFPQRSA